nr:hypothetical protein BaRGS_004754 [Batillaria attramentaria]
MTAIRYAVTVAVVAVLTFNFFRYMDTDVPEGKKIKLQIPIYPCLQLLDLQTPSYIENKQYIPGMLNDVSMLTYWMNYGNISYDFIDKFLANQHTSQKIKRSKYAKRISPEWYMPEHIRTPSLRAMTKPDNFGDDELFARYEKTLLDP